MYDKASESPVTGPVVSALKKTAIEKGTAFLKDKVGSFGQGNFFGLLGR